jgi:DNA invertase Pin-like site-specific DNA recombinase
MEENAYQYLRVSGKGQIDRDGFNRQRDVCSFYANQHDIEIIGEFVEKGVSGTTDAYDREALTALFEAIKANGVRLVLVETPSRIARDLMISEILLGEFRKLGVRVISAECGTELTTQDGDISCAGIYAFQPVNKLDPAWAQVPILFCFTFQNKGFIVGMHHISGIAHFMRCLNCIIEHCKMV